MIFKVIGIVVAFYVFYAAASGRVFAKSGPGGRTIVQQETPIYFWMVIVIYAGLSAALVIFF